MCGLRGLPSTTELVPSLQQPRDPLLPITRPLPITSSSLPQPIPAQPTTGRRRGHARTSGPIRGRLEAGPSQWEAAAGNQRTNASGGRRLAIFRPHGASSTFHCSSADDGFTAQWPELHCKLIPSCPSSPSIYRVEIYLQARSWWLVAGGWWSWAKQCK